MLHMLPILFSSASVEACEVSLPHGSCGCPKSGCKFRNKPACIVGWYGWGM
jgi:hypothetical protein